MTDRTFATKLQPSLLLQHYSAYHPPTPQQQRQSQLYYSLRQMIEECMGVYHYSKHVRIRIGAWIQKLSKEEYDWRQQQNRNNYLRLLHLMMECQVMVSPFSSLPHEELPFLNKTSYTAIVNQVQYAIRQNRNQNRRRSHCQCPWTSHTYKAKVKQSGLPYQQSMFNSSVPSRQPKRTTQMSHVSAAKKVWLKSTMNDEEKENKISSEVAKELKQPLSFQGIYPGSQENGAMEVRVQEKFQQIAGMKMSSFISKKLRNFIRSSRYQRVNIQSEIADISEPEPTESQRRCLKQSVAKDHCLQPLKLSNLLEQRYWQSNSYNENGTPKYLTVYPSHPYASLALSSSDVELDSSRVQPCDCICNIFSKNHTEANQS